MTEQSNPHDAAALPTATGRSTARHDRVRRPDRVAHVLDGERAVLLHLPTGRRVVLSPEATAVWQLVIASGLAGVSSDAVTATLAPRYATDADVIAADVHALIQQLAEQDLVELVEPD